MAIVPVAKLTLYGTANQKDAVLDDLQELGCVHLINLGEADNPVHSPPTISAETYQALRFLRTCPTRRRPQRESSGFELDKVVQETLLIEQRQQHLQQERDELAGVIRDLTPWGDFHLPPVGELGDLQFWFYVVPHYQLRSLWDQHQVMQVVARDHQFAYLVVLKSSEPVGMPVPCVHLDVRSLTELHGRFEMVESELEDLYWRRVALTRWVEMLSQTIALANDLAARERAAKQSWDDASLFVLQGWAPQLAIHQIRAFARRHELGLTMDRPSADDSPPTLLNNRGLAAGGQDAVTFYTTPAYRAWDPSSVVFVSFSLFFAMIMADVGYALLLGSLLLVLWRRIGKAPGGARLRRLLSAMVVVSVIYGIAVGSYFGLPPARGSIWQKLHVIDAANTTRMMLFSIVVGVVHLSLANLALGWSRRWSPTMLASLGWVALLWGGLSVGLGKSQTSLQAAWVLWGSWGMVAGIVAVLLFSSNRPILTFKLQNHGRRILDGVLALTNITRAFGDVLSYLRLFALGLASAQLAATFNELTYKASCCIGVGSLLAVLVVMLGHGLNFVLAIMSGVVHGLRLNCIEFFGWSLPEEGYPFEPFCKKAA